MRSPFGWDLPPGTPALFRWSATVTCRFGHSWVQTGWDELGSHFADEKTELCPVCGMPPKDDEENWDREDLMEQVVDAREKAHELIKPLIGFEREFICSEDACCLVCDVDGKYTKLCLERCDDEFSPGTCGYEECERRPKDEAPEEV